jgi:calcineurin-like phosphoesterase family protein
MLVSDQWRLSEWMLKDSGLDWLFVIGGNHDSWASGYGHDPLKWLSKRCGVRFYAPDQLRLDIEWIDRPDIEPYKILSRHFFKGHSWFHPTHGSQKQAMLDNANLLLSGHIHTWGQLSTEQMHNRITHAISLRGYKKQDKYSVQKGFMNNQEYGESCLIIIDPDKQGPARTKIFWDIEGGCEYLTYLRSKYKID